MSKKYEVFVRNQFIFSTSAKKLAKILTQLVSNCDPLNVNTVARCINNLQDDLLLVVMVVGTDDPTTTTRGGAGTPPHTNEEQNERFREILKCNKVIFRENSVIQITNLEIVTGTPGVYRIAYVALFCGDIKILRSYDGEPVTGEIISTFFQVPEDQVLEAVNILENFDLSNPKVIEKQLCINRFNVPDCPKCCKKKKKCKC